MRIVEVRVQSPCDVSLVAGCWQKPPGLCPPPNGHRPRIISSRISVSWRNPEKAMNERHRIVAGFGRIADGEVLRHPHRPELRPRSRVVAPESAGVSLRFMMCVDTQVLPFVRVRQSALSRSHVAFGTRAADSFSLWWTPPLFPAIFACRSPRSQGVL